MSTNNEERRHRGGGGGQASQKRDDGGIGGEEGGANEVRTKKKEGGGDAAHKNAIKDPLTSPKASSFPSLKYSFSLLIHNLREQVTIPPIALDPTPLHTSQCSPCVNTPSADPFIILGNN